MKLRNKKHVCISVGCVFPYMVPSECDRDPLGLPPPPTPPDFPGQRPLPAQRSPPPLRPIHRTPCIQNDTRASRAVKKGHWWKRGRSREYEDDAILTDPKIVLLYDKVNRTCTPFSIYLINAYIMIPNHTSSIHPTHTTLFGWVILISMMSMTQS